MITLKLQRYRKGRIWTDALPNASYPVIKTIERTLDIKESNTTKARCVAIELFIPTGARALYGLLGAEFTPLAGDQLVVRASIAAEDDRLFSETIASGDWVYIGLPEYFASGVLDGACSTDTVTLLGPGLLNFNRAAYGHVGSSLVVFRRLADAVVHLLTADTASMSEAELSHLIQLQWPK